MGYIRVPVRHFGVSTTIIWHVRAHKYPGNDIFRARGQTRAFSRSLAKVKIFPTPSDVIRLQNKNKLLAEDHSTLIIHRYMDIKVGLGSPWTPFCLLLVG